MNMVLLYGIEENYCFCSPPQTVNPTWVFSPLRLDVKQGKESASDSQVTILPDLLRGKSRQTLPVCACDLIASCRRMTQRQLLRDLVVHHKGEG